MKKSELKRRLAAVEQMRPMWARGYSSDSVAAQVAHNALTQLWGLLGAANQTEAVLRVKELLHTRKAK